MVTKGTSQRQFNDRLKLLVTAASVVILVKLGLVSAEHDNWRGFFYSALHVLLVGAGGYLAIVRR